MESTPNLDLPYLMPSQAQKHVTHNEALQLVDAVVQLAAISDVQKAPPATPAEGDRYIVAAGGTGEWSGWDGDIAAWIDGRWMRLAPRTGWRCWVQQDDKLLVRNDGTWQRLEGLPANAAFEALAVGTLPDAVNRLSVKSDSVLLSHDDVTPGSGNMHVTVNKAGAGKDAAIFFQNNWSSRAGMGCFGGDRFQIKVSSDGAAWKDTLNIEPATGNVGVGTSTPKGRLHVTSQDYLSITVSNSNSDAVAKGGMVCGARYNLADAPFVCFGSWDRGATAGQREVFFGGGGWNLPDATHLRFYTAPAYTETNNTGLMRMVITSSGNVGIGVSSPTAMLHVNGSLSKTSGSFDIAHPDPALRQTHRLRHCFVEAPTRGENIYRFVVDANAGGAASVPLPGYWKHLNENPQVWVSPSGHFGRAHGAVNAEATALELICETPGRYNVLLLATRRDDDAKAYFDARGVEYERPADADDAPSGIAG
ncbi:DUF2793 domain-containing protein [Mesorhizobium sp. SP-1A]|uniref:DUF2793 domain-containing protein n=1 Tax=Mesorhizobium sp. SP-1A TaxID=3077840 RepID=UPI0028F6D192|nr:DUF2793 domain-containing protein [Mesorhizobium sp. SP-1A]